MVGSNLPPGADQDPRAPYNREPPMIETKAMEVIIGVDIDTPEDAADIDAYATGLTVSTSRKVNLGDYENAEPYAALRAEVRPALALSADGATEALREQAERLGRVVGYHVTQAAEAYREDVTERKGVGR